MENAANSKIADFVTKSACNLVAAAAAIPHALNMLSQLQKQQFTLRIRTAKFVISSSDRLFSVCVKQFGQIVT